MLCGKSIFDSMNQKLLDCAEIRLAVHVRPMNEMSCLSSLQRGVYLRGTHGQISSHLRKRGPIRTVSAKFENYDDVLGLECHGDIIHSLFANSECVRLVGFWTTPDQVNPHEQARVGSIAPHPAYA